MLEFKGVKMKNFTIRESVLAIAVILLLVVICFLISDWSFLRVTNNVSWKLPNNDRLSYLIYDDAPRHFVADVKKILVWRKSDGSLRAFSISNIGSAPQNVQLKINEKKSILWLISIRRTGDQETKEYLCALNIETGDFASSAAMRWDEKAHGNLAELSKNPNIRLIKEIALQDEGHIIKPSFTNTAY